MIRRLAKAKVSRLKDFLAVDGMGDGQAQLLVVEGWIGDIELDGATRRIARFGEANALELAVANFLDPLVGSALRHIDIAGLKRGEAYRGVANDPQDHAIDVGFVPPVVGEALEDDALLWCPLDKFERAGAGRKSIWIFHSLRHRLFGNHRKGLDSSEGVFKPGRGAFQVNV